MLYHCTGSLALSNALFVFQNFRLHYKEVGLECGGELVLNSASDVAWFSSPEYPDSPSHDVTCEWIIRGPLGSGLQLSLVLEKFFPCDLNSTSLEVYRGGTDLAGLVSRSCMPAHNPNSILISSHITLVRYVLTKRDFHSKFNATIRADSCNREYYVSGRMANVVLPLGGPGKVNFGGATRCTLRLRTHTNFYITLNVSSLQLQGNNCTSGDVIEFRDSEGAPFYFKRFCAPKNSTDFSYQLASAQNELFISYERVNYQSTPAEVASLKKVGITFSVETKYRSKYFYAEGTLFLIRIFFFVRMRSSYQRQGFPHRRHSLPELPKPSESPSLLLLANSWRYWNSNRASLFSI